MQKNNSKVIQLKMHNPIKVMPLQKHQPSTRILEEVFFDLSNISAILENHLKTPPNQKR